jgi:FkbM family methyltransferase
MKNTTLRSILIKVLFPIVFIVRAFRSHRQMSNWRKYIVNGFVTVSPILPKGLFRIDIRSHLSSLIFTGKYEPEVMIYLSGVPPKDGLIVNIGANIGFYSVHLANLFPNSLIIAVEPNPEAFSLLVENVKLNNLNNRVKTENLCIGSTRGKESLSFIPGNPEYSSMRNIVHSSVARDAQCIVSVDCVRLSDIVGTSKVFMIVIDVEGAEHIVLEGGRDVISRDHPIIVFESADLLLKNFGSSSSELVCFLKELGYTVRSLEGKNSFGGSVFEGNLVAIYN